MKKLFSFKEKNNEKEYEFALKQPNRTEREEIEIYYAAMLSKLTSYGGRRVPPSASCRAGLAADPGIEYGYIIY